MPAELVIPQQNSIGRAAVNPIPFFVHLLEQGALVEFGGLLEVFQEFLLGDVEDLDLEQLPSLALIQQVPKAAPTGLQLLEGIVMQDFVQLQREQSIDFPDLGVNGGFYVLVQRDGLIEYLLNERSYEVHAPFRL